MVVTSTCQYNTVLELTGKRSIAWSILSWVGIKVFYVLERSKSIIAAKSVDQGLESSATDAIVTETRRGERERNDAGD